ncbi:MAG: flagellar export protein FliJ [Deltaproteobacteria bacterium]|nr:flagellar export protein FliJ [Deltaproteobacteria bacterium]
MKKFKYKLQGMLRIKQSVEKEIRNELMGIQRLVAEQENKIKDTEEKVSDWSSYYNTVMRRGFNAVQLSIIDYHIQGLYRYREQLMISLEVYQRKKEDVIRQYTEVKREVKMLEHLRDKRLNEYRAEFNRQEEKLSDEMAVLSFARQAM